MTTLPTLKVTPKTGTYRLTSTKFVDAPSIVAYCQHGYASTRSKAQKSRFVDVLKAWHLASDVAEKLCKGAVPFTIGEEREVIFSL